MNIPRLLALALGAVLLSAAALAHQEHSGDQFASERPAQPPLIRNGKDKGTPDARSYFTDTLLLDQNGRQLRFYSDVLRNRVVLLNVIYTKCEDACPLITSRLKEVRHALGSQANNVYFITLTSDPKNDTPEVLKAYARKHGVDKRNWIFLTGGEEQLALVLSRLGMPTLHPRSPQEHSTMLIAGDVANRHWTKIRPDAEPKAIAQHLQLMTMPVAGR